MPGGTVLTQALPADPNATPYDAMIAELRARMNQQQPAMYTPEQIAQRQQQNEQQYQLGMLGMLSGNEGLQGAGGAVFKQALADRTPKITEHGLADSLSGKFTYSPDYQQQRYEAQIQGLEAKQAAVLEARRAAQQHGELIKALQTERLDKKENAPGTFSAYGTGPAGENIVENTKTGLRFKVDAGPDGKPVYTAWTGAVTPKGTFEKNVEAAGTALGAASRATQLINLVQADPSAFGFRANAISAAPGWAQGYLAPAVGLTPEQLTKRAGLLRQAAMETHELYGAAQSAGELARAATFMPLPTDTPEITLAKLQAAVDWAKESAKQKGPAAVQAAQERAPGLVVPPTGAGATPAAPEVSDAPLTPQQEARRQELRRRHLGG